MTKTNVLFEIGLEEMPARFLNGARQQLEQKTVEWLDSLRLPYESIKTYTTPRRLAVFIEGVANKQPDMEDEVRGPAKKIALDKEGNWSKAAIGFSNGQGKTVDDIYFKDVKGTEYVFINKFIEGKKTKELLPQFQDIILGLTFPKNMRWGNYQLRYARPIRWLVALHGSDIVPLQVENVSSGNRTFGHRFLGKEIEINNSDSYVTLLKEQYVIVSPEERKELIVEGLKQLEETKDWQIMLDKELLDEVHHLVEYPTVFFGQFSEEFLEVPDEALITSMKEHQRYFPVLSKDGKLLPYFVAVRNGNDQYIETVAKGNEKVLRARLSDARFFYEEDQKLSIEHNLEKLTRMVFQERLGTIADKVNRVVSISSNIAHFLDLDEEQTNKVIRAATISKFDLVTNMVNEFTELQGIMGEKYAVLFGEDPNVAKAVNEHYMPRASKGKLPTTIEGAIVSVADKLDTIVGCISVGLLPTGSQDPYALRRQSLGVLQIINERKWNVTVEKLISSTQDVYDTVLSGINKIDVAQNIKEFFKGRATYILKEQQIDQDIIEAVLSGEVGVVSFTLDKANILSRLKQDESFKLTQEGLVRVLNLATKGEDLGVDVELFENDYERELYSAYQTTKDQYIELLKEQQGSPAMDVLSNLATPIHQFFEHTMVMAEDEKIQSNRLSLLNKIAELVFMFADFTKIQWKQQY
ncbi:glycine--tRNA ligase subunit beta [Aquibacillus salsiterrae]|uniref:Glycine--tRNA ligase beta subunit n=1 Tax=Aquibacillus salsiterrae TaxID=2950439 RepID=A0A9X3WDP7_9BACI|nr:glycine--tRNA ligase subunit beta [Aquibacillus salsiterrae]MDC3415549.1 glycine--tRNA ligase subunit beta [Aquibacillus salsiterrae]